MIGSNSLARKGQRLTLDRFNATTESALSARMMQNDSVVSSMVTPRGTFAQFKASGIDVSPCYVVGLDYESRLVLCKIATPLSDDWSSEFALKWEIRESDSAIIEARPWPGYGLPFFEHHVIVGPQPVVTDLSCELYGGKYIKPDFRMLISDVLLSSQIAEPCEPVESAESEGGCSCRDQ